MPKTSAERALLYTLAIFTATLLMAASACGGSGPGMMTDDEGRVLSSEPTPGPPPSSSSASGDAPLFTAETFEHGPYSLDQSAGRPVVINFWFPSCPPCASELPDLEAAFQKYGDRVDFVGVQLVGIDSPSAGKTFLREKGVTYPSFADQNSTVQKAYRVFAYPTTVFLDSDHGVKKVWAGLISARQIEDNIEAALNAS